MVFDVCALLCSREHANANNTEFPRHKENVTHTSGLICLRLFLCVCVWWCCRSDRHRWFFCVRVLCPSLFHIGHAWRYALARRVQGRSNSSSSRLSVAPLRAQCLCTGLEIIQRDTFTSVSRTCSGRKRHREQHKDSVVYYPRV